MDKSIDDKLITKLGIASLIYAILFAIFMYGNIMGIGIFLTSIITVIYVRYYLKLIDRKFTKGTLILTIIFILLAVSTMTTGNTVIITFNYLMMIVVLISLLVNQIYDLRSFSLWPYGIVMFKAMVGPFTYIPKPFKDLVNISKTKEQGNKTKNNSIIIGTLIAIPLAVILLILLSRADAVFAAALKSIIRIDLNIYSITQIVVLLLLGFFSSYCVLRYIFYGDMTLNIKERKLANPTIASTVLIVVSVIYGIFDLIQIIFLFGKLGGLPEGYTYAKYAREGFFELLAVCIINLVMVLVIVAFFEKKKSLDGLMIFTCICTYIMLASSAYRMIIYIGAYGLTELRFTVIWALITIGILFVGIIITIVKKDYPLTRFALLTISICYLVLSLSHMDYWIADYNIKNQSSQDLDVNYLMDLSTDAAIPISSLGEERYTFAFNTKDVVNELPRQFNLSHYIANKVMKADYDMSENSFCIVLSTADEGAEEELKSAKIEFRDSDGKKIKTVNMKPNEYILIPKKTFKDPDNFEYTATLTFKDGQKHVCESEEGYFSDMFRNRIDVYCSDNIYTVTTIDY